MIWLIKTLLNNYINITSLSHGKRDTYCVIIYIVSTVIILTRFLPLRMSGIWWMAIWRGCSWGSTGGRRTFGNRGWCLWRSSPRKMPHVHTHSIKNNLQHPCLTGRPILVQDNIKFQIVIFHCKKRKSTNNNWSRKINNISKKKASICM